MKRLMLLHFIFLIAALSTQAQNGSNTSQFGDAFLRSLDLQKEDSPINKDIAGSPYLQKDWTAAKIYAREGEIIEALMRYDAYHDVMVVKQGEDLFTLQGSFISKIEIAGKSFSRFDHPITENNPRQWTYLEVQSFGDIFLLKRYYVKLVKGKKAAAYSPSTPDELKLREEWYTFRLGDERPMELKKGKKRVLGIFKKKANRVKSFAKKNKLSFRKEADLVKIFDYYNGLMEKTE